MKRPTVEHSKQTNRKPVGWTWRWSNDHHHVSSSRLVRRSSGRDVSAVCGGCSEAVWLIAVSDEWERVRWAGGKVHQLDVCSDWSTPLKCKENETCLQKTSDCHGGRNESQEGEAKIRVDWWRWWVRASTPWFNLIWNGDLKLNRLDLFSLK